MTTSGDAPARTTRIRSSHGQGPVQNRSVARTPGAVKVLAALTLTAQVPAVLLPVRSGWRRLRRGGPVPEPEFSCAG